MKLFELISGVTNIRNSFGHNEDNVLSPYKIAKSKIKKYILKGKGYEATEQIIMTALAEYLNQMTDLEKDGFWKEVRRQISS